MRQSLSADHVKAAREYLRTHEWRRRAQRTADRYGESRSALWRFLWTEHVVPMLIAAVVNDIGASV